MKFILSVLAPLIREALLYAGASPHSRRHQLETLNGLDDRLLRDIGLDRSLTPDGRLDHGASSTGI